MNKPIVIQEKDIVRITITDTKAFIILEKDKYNDEYYNMRYMYSKYMLNDDEHYCDICGSIWKYNHKQCTENDRKRYRYDEMIDFVYDCLEDNLKVDITTNNEKEQKYYSFEL